MPVQHIPVVDLFAGPGGLGEGFSALQHRTVKFEVLLSVEKEQSAYDTLLLRSFFRNLSEKSHGTYYEYLRGRASREELFRAHPAAANTAAERCLHLEMGPRTTQRIYSYLERAVKGAQHWVLVGGPPCQAYSIVGRSRLARVTRKAFEESEKHVLYREYLRILARYKPPVFVMENVKGLLSATYAGSSTFERILSDLSSPSVAVREAPNGRKPTMRRGAEYAILSFVHPGKQTQHLRPENYLIPAEKFGIPQRRHRVILLGVRSDLMLSGDLTLRPSAAPALRDVLMDLPPLRSQLSRGDDGKWAEEIRYAMDKINCADADGLVRDAMMATVEHLRPGTGIGGRVVARQLDCSLPKTELTRWLLDPIMTFVCNHETRKHIPEDLVRYLFTSCYAKVHGTSPKLYRFPRALLPLHRNVEDTVKRRHGYFNDRFRVQVDHQPATTVTSHICKDGHYFIHHDPMQCRSWTVREAARVQTFPDNYFFEGTRTQQYLQVGNAVPPYLALQIAGVVANMLEAQR